MKLHLGCGQNYLKGYVNIDFPAEKHSVQKTSVADKLADILLLKYDSNSIEEIRMHHVFEHFERSVAFGLLTTWSRWLKLGGKLRIEVPDFYRNSLTMLNPMESMDNKLKAERHIFGSQEAAWAIHYEGYTSQTISYVLEHFGFKIERIKIIKWCGLYNIDVLATKVRDADINIATLLTKYLVDSSTSEQELLGVWLNKYDKQIKKGK